MSFLLISNLGGEIGTISKLTSNLIIGGPVAHRLGEEGVDEQDMIDSAVLVSFVTLADVGTQQIGSLSVQILHHKTTTDKVFHTPKIPPISEQQSNLIGRFHSRNIPFTR